MFSFYLVSSVPLVTGAQTFWMVCMVRPSPVHTQTTRVLQNAESGSGDLEEGLGDYSVADSFEMP